MNGTCGTCGTCGAAIRAEYHLCHDHTVPMEQHLNDLPDIIAELRTTMARQDAGADSLGGGSTTAQPAINLDALDAYEQLRAVIIGWAVALQGRSFYFITTTEEAGAYLLANMDLVRRQYWAPDLAVELAAAVRRAVTTTDRAANKISLGECGNVFEGVTCTDTMTAVVGEAYGRCRTCGATVNVHDHQRALIDAAWGVRDTLPAILRALKKSGHGSIPLDRAEKWVERGKLAPVIPFLRRYTARDVLATYEQTPMGKRVMETRKAKAERNTTLSHAA